MFNRIYPSLFMILPNDIREKLVEVFNIEASGPREVRDNELIRDGRTEQDLAVITLEKMNEYIGSSETSFERAWQVTCAKAYSELNPVTGVIGKLPEAEEAPVIEVKVKTNESTKSK